MPCYLIYIYYSNETGNDITKHKNSVSLPPQTHTHASTCMNTHNSTPTHNSVAYEIIMYILCAVK
jgi:hypothetical protein